MDNELLVTGVDVMTALNGHPNIVKFYGAYEDEKCIYIAMEFLDGGSLQDALNLRGGVCDEMEAKRWTQQIVAALEALHMQRIAHRDMKLENIMLDFKGDVKLIDFGLSDYVFPGEKLSKLAGSRGYIAPEVFDKKRGIASDMWSLGVLAHVLLTGEFSFPDPQDPSDIDAWRPDMSQGPDFRDSAVWGSVSDEAAEFLRLLLDPQPSLRITAAQAKAHEWFCHDAYGSSSGSLSRDQHSLFDLSLSCAF
ncbi:hypothetical protein LUZ60_007706 [Juncus effusus]|nr:hypothetical protein LUZ60_007706 [Juncus effusus]